MQFKARSVIISVSRDVGRISGDDLNRIVGGRECVSANSCYPRLPRPGIKIVYCLPTIARTTLESCLDSMSMDVKSVVASWNWHSLADLTQWVVDEALRIQQIAAPTFHEKERALHVANRFRGLRLDDIDIDDLKNVFGRIAGKRSDLAILVLAHTDTVFSADTDLRIQRCGNLIYGPGIGDNSVGVAAMLGTIKAIIESGHTPDCDLWFVADSCEEGLGDLRGAKAAYACLQTRVRAVINLEGLALGHVYNAGIAVHRLRISAKAEGGHSWLHHGRPSATHAVMELGHQITSLDVPASPRTTCNIGMIDGGHAINAIATEASLWLDMRSVCAHTLSDLRQRVCRLVEQNSDDGLQFVIETVGKRPSGSIADDHVLVIGALSALAEIGIMGTLETGSTDGNVPLSQGCPAVTIGITRGGNAHRLDEYIEVSPIRFGLKQLITLVLASARHYANADMVDSQKY